MYLVTEPVEPLVATVKDLTELDIALGVHTIGSSLSFLHSSAGMMHNNIRLSSIFVSQTDNLWRLGGLELITKFNEEQESLIGSIIRASSPESPASPEDIDGTFTSNQIHSRDSWMLGHLIIRLFDRFNGTSDGKLMKFKQTIKKTFCNADPRKRPKIKTFLSNHYFQSLPQQALIESVHFLENITIKSEEEKQRYFRRASNDLFHVSSASFQKYLMRLLFSDLIFADENAREFLLPRLLSVKTNRESKGFYKADSYFRIMGPLLKELLKRRAKHTRLVVLRLSRWYIPFLPTHFVKDFILPEVLLGLKDTDDAIVMGTFNALAVLTSVLGSTVVVGGERKSNFYDTIPRGFDRTVNHASCGDQETTFEQALNGNVVNDSDLDSGKEYTLAHESHLEAEREKRAEEFKKRRAALTRKRKELQEKKEKLIEVAATKSEYTPDKSEGITSEMIDPGILRKERFTHQHFPQKPLLIHERAGLTMEYTVDKTIEPGLTWDSESGPELPEEEEEETNKESLLSIVKRQSESDVADNDEIDSEVMENEDKSTPVNLSRMSMQQLDAALPNASSNDNDRFSNWENGGWSDFDNQFESDAGIELQNLKSNIEEQPELSHSDNKHPSVSDFMNFEISIAPESEPDFFADMKPTYQAPKLL